MISWISAASAPTTSPSKPARSVAIAAVVAVVVALGCGRRATDTFPSNFGRFRLVEHRVVDAKTGAAYTGTLIARDHEISAVASLVLAGTPLEPLGTRSPSGLILVASVRSGVLVGRASLRLDLQAQPLNRELDDSSWAAAIARGLRGTFEVAEGTLKDGKLEGSVSVFEPLAGNPLRTTILAKAEFRDGALDGAALEYYPGTAQPKREISFARGARSGLTRTFYPGGQLESEVRFVDGVRHGAYRELYPDGATRAAGSYERDELTGTARWWFPTGGLQRETIYDATGPHVTEWYSNGQLASKRGPQGSTDFPATGLILEYHANGVIKSRAHYAQGLREGELEVFYDSGARWEVARYEHGELHGRQRKWWTNGRLALDTNWLGGALHGRYQRWYPSGKTWEVATYDRGAQVGAHRKWWSNGRLALESAWLGGALHGRYQRWYPSGKTWEAATYDHGARSGAYRKWWNNGQLAELSSYDRGQRDGPYRTYYETGAKWLIGEYREGRRLRPMERFFRDGTRLTTRAKVGAALGPS
jgi:antitoxin component YwqK of YwqJK toxin-antitoxin module